ncbi:MAG: cell division protein FtsA [Dysgonamonadaceae bacterium]|jgi:cell division protein FtsA|nr:cell division protein FtsA [Dysgonamonadaceae bacterium]
MNRTEYVAALDIGTSKIVAAVARKNEKGILTILASEKEETENCIRRGYIYNADTTLNKISRIIRKLNDKLRNRSLPNIEQIYAGIGGQSIHIEWHCIKKEINTRVTRELLDTIDEEICRYAPELVEILEILPPEFYLDGQLENNPKGAAGSVIEARYPLITNDLFLRRNLKSLLEGKINIAGFHISPLATAEAVLTAEDKEAGCALIELGAGLTYLSIYKNSKLKHLFTIPLGASTITKDIGSLNISEKEAEELKIKYGSALIEYDNDGKITAREIAQREELKDFDNVVEARSDEIIANIKYQIEQSGYKSALGAGIIITGGGALLKNIQTSLKQKIGIRVSLAPNRCLDAADAETATQSGYATVTGLLLLSKANCAKETRQEKPTENDLFGDKENTGNPPVKPAPEKEPHAQGNTGGKKKKKSFINWGSSLFDN